MVFWFPSIYFSDPINCDGVDYQYTFWKNGSTGYFNAVWHIRYHAKNGIQTPKHDPKMDQYEFGLNDWVKLNFK